MKKVIVHFLYLGIVIILFYLSKMESSKAVISERMAVEYATRSKQAKQDAQFTVAENLKTKDQLKEIKQNLDSCLKAKQ